MRNARPAPGRLVAANPRPAEVELGLRPACRVAGSQPGFDCPSKKLEANALRMRKRKRKQRAMQQRTTRAPRQPAAAEPVAAASKAPVSTKRVLFQQFWKIHEAEIF